MTAHSQKPPAEAAAAAGPASAADSRVTGSAIVVHEGGLHARPSVKLTKLAKTFAARIDMALTAGGPWIDAKSIVKVMAAKAPKGTTLHFRAEGLDGAAAVAALVALVEQDFGDDDPGP